MSGSNIVLSSSYIWVNEYISFIYGLVGAVWKGMRWYWGDGGVEVNWCGRVCYCGLGLGSSGWPAHTLDSAISWSADGPVVGSLRHL